VNAVIHSSIFWLSVALYIITVYKLPKDYLTAITFPELILGDDVGLPLYLISMEADLCHHVDALATIPVLGLSLTMPLGLISIFPNTRQQNSRSERPYAFQ